MIEVVLGFCAGYILKGLLGVPQRFDTLLMWDSTSFGWRVVPPSVWLDPTKKYLAAVEFVPGESEQR